MIIEIIGPSGVGKSYLIYQTMTKLNELGYDVDGVHEQWFTRNGNIPMWLHNPRRHNIITDIKITPWSLLFFLLNLRFMFFAIYMISRSRCGLYQKICIGRALWRKAGMNVFFKRKYFDSYIIFIDEGICHSIHNFLVFPDSSVDKESVRKFAELVPLSNILVLLSGSKEQLLKNLDERGDLSPRIKDRSELLWFLKNSIQAFDIMMSIPRISLNTLHLQYGDAEAVDKLITTIIDKIKNK